MTCTDTRDVKATVRQIRALEKVGCEAVRVALPDREAAQALPAILKGISCPLIADIHFHDRLALAAIAAGVAGIRINPGNFPRAKVRDIVRAAKERGTTIRVGINAGSLEKGLLAKHNGPTAAAMVESALGYVALFEDMGFHALKLSLKSSDVRTTLAAYRRISGKTDHPLHLGLTEAGLLLPAAIKSAVSLGILLAEGIGDTLRVSVTGSPLPEVAVAFGILRALGIRRVGPEIIACPTCGRSEIDVARLARRVEHALRGMREPLTIALMGCVVNGPGEAAEADIGLAGGRKVGLLFKKGKAVGKVPEGEFLPVLLDEIRRMTGFSGRPARPASGSPPSA
jgi:(E)-4-hydroxy-3-methylbut-2-enyl-diphosphate synthase